MFIHILIRNFICSVLFGFCLSSSSFCIERSSILSDKSCIFSSISVRDLLISSICRRGLTYRMKYPPAAALILQVSDLHRQRLSCVVAYEIYGIVRDRLKVQAANIYFYML